MELDENIIELSKIISTVESDGNINAIRYEPNWKWLTPQLISICVNQHKCSDATARMLLSCSYGKYQIMGSVLYELGYQGKLTPDFLNNESLQDIYFAKYLKARKATMPVKSLLRDDGRRFFAVKYNGNGAISHYAARIALVMKMLGYEVN